jgi:hypothetical protein
MKRILLLLIATATLGLASCKKDTIIQEVPNKTILLTINPQDWVASENGSTFSIRKSIPEINAENIEIGGILVYLDHPVNVNSNIQLPYVFEGISYSYEQLQGALSIDIQAADFPNKKPNRPTVKMFLKVVLIPSRDIT